MSHCCFYCDYSCKTKNQVSEHKNVNHSNNFTSIRNSQEQKTRALQGPKHSTRKNSVVKVLPEDVSLEVIDKSDVIESDLKNATKAKDENDLKMVTKENDDIDSLDNLDSLKSTVEHYSVLYACYRCENIFAEGTGLREHIKICSFINESITTLT